MESIRRALFSKMTAEGRSNEMALQFKIMDTDKLRVAMALSTMDTFEIIPPALCEVKNSKTSIDLRNEANRILVSSKDNVEELIKAWELYSRSIATAPNLSQELSLTYANRSILLMKLHKYAECIEDIDRALELNYPSHLVGKLLCRKIECLTILNQTINLKDTFEQARLWLENINLSNDDRNKFEEKLKSMENSNCLAFFSEAKRIKEFPMFIPHKKIPCASEALTIKYNDEFGRHIVTTRKVNPGEILVMEKPYSIMLASEEVYTHCSYCLQVYWAMIPCEFCINAMYCSYKCKSKAWKQYHDIECAVTGYLLGLDFNKNNLFSMRLTILALREAGSIEKLKMDLDTADKCQDPYKKGFTENGLYSDKYYSIYSLVTNTEKREISDLFERALNAAFILYYLCTVTTLFGKKFNNDIHEINMNVDVTYIGGLILRHMQIIPSNIHSVFLYFNFEEERRIDTVDIGASALPFCSLINHSCDPNVSRCSTEDHMIIFAILPIQKGSQVFDNYGSHYAVMNKFERTEKLKQFHFKCECMPCIKDWPTYENLLSFHKLLSNKEVKRKVEKALEKFNSYVEYATEDKIANKPYLLTDLSRMIDILIKYVPLPCCEVNNVVETLKRVFALTYGNKFEIPKLNE